MTLRITVFVRSFKFVAAALALAMSLIVAVCAGVQPDRTSATADRSLPASKFPAGWPAAEAFSALRATPKRWSAWRTACDRHLDYVAQPMADFAPPPHYVDRIGEQRVAHSLTADGGMAYRQALCFALSGDLRYAKVAERILNAWASGVKHIGPGQGVADFNFTFAEYVLAADMLRADAQWRDVTFRAFVRTRVLPLSTASRPNNFGNWGVLLEASSASYLGDRALLERAVTRWKTLVLSQVATDGSMPREICRSNTTDLCGGPDKGVNGLAYTHYALLPTAISAEIFRNEGIDVYAGPAGQRLSAAYERAASWTLRPETFPYYASNGGQLNGARNAAYFRILQLRLPCAEGAAVLRQGDLAMDGYQLALLYGGDR